MFLSFFNTLLSAATIVQFFILQFPFGPFSSPELQYATSWAVIVTTFIMAVCHLFNVEVAIDDTHGEGSIIWLLGMAAGNGANSWAAIYCFSMGIWGHTCPGEKPHYSQKENFAGLVCGGVALLVLLLVGLRVRRRQVEHQSKIKARAQRPSKKAKKNYVRVKLQQ